MLTLPLRYSEVPGETSQSYGASDTKHVNDVKHNNNLYTVINEVPIDNKQ